MGQDIGKLPFADDSRDGMTASSIASQIDVMSAPSPQKIDVSDHTGGRGAFTVASAEVLAAEARINARPLAYPLCPTCNKILEDCGCDGLQKRLTIKGPGSSEMAEACALVNGTRQDDYGTPRSNYEGIAKVWSGILCNALKRDITPDEAALMMVGLKLQRQAQKHKRDNLVDAHGYLLVYAHIRNDGQ